MDFGGSLKKRDKHIYAMLPVIPLKEEPITRFFKRKPEKPNVDHLIDVLLHDKSNDKRYDAAVRLGMLHDLKAVPALFEAATDRSIGTTASNTRYFQVAATEALGEIGGPEAIEVLSKLLRQSARAGITMAAVEALKKLGAFDILQKYHRFSGQSWKVLILDENGNICAHERGLETTSPHHLEPGDYVRIEYSIADMDGSRKPYAVGEAKHSLDGSYYLGIVDLEARRLHLERAFDGVSTIDLASDPVELTPAQKKAFKDFFQAYFKWYRATKEIEEILR